MEELQASHRKEQRDLQSRVAQKKKNATKKTRKGVYDECEAIERELKERQKAELDALDGGDIANGVHDLHLDGDVNAIPEEPQGDLYLSSILPETNGTIAGPTSPSLDTISSATTGPKKRNRQKERLARRAAEQDTAIAVAESEAANMPDQREIELNSMAEHRARLNLEEIAIRPDGHCLYSAVATSLPAATVKESGPYATGYQNVRYVAAEFIVKHPDDFSPFLEEPVDVYTKKIKDTSEWGGAIELQALARAFGKRINVLQSDGRIENIGEEKDGDEQIWLAYYRHSFGLGEHYNALKRNGDEAS